jgi:DNA-binding MarR family transcriptional regulator
LHLQVCRCYAHDVPSSRLTDAEMRAWQALLHAHHEVAGSLEGELQQGHGLSLADYDVLVRLARASDRSLRMSDLAERVMLSPSGLTRLVDRLVARGLVERLPDPVDGRAALASLTEEGHRRVVRAARTHLRGIREHFTGRLTERQLLNVASGLESITGPHQPH